jgi:radical SAM superfamily enzyme YgiQ (UPF0313 family)
MKQRCIDPVSDLGGLLLTVEKPARYTGGEYGRLARADAALRALIAFPDLYEIGMSNQALRIIYNGLNRVPDVSCDRAFAPAPDFEKLLRETGLPLYGLDTGIRLGDLDLLLVTLGYELGISGLLTMLDVSGIPLRGAGRNDAHPVIIAGGPAVSNPLPYAAFIDAFWIGEAEAGFFDLAAELAELKKAGRGRAALLAKTAAHPCVWVPGKEHSLRAIYSGFGGNGEGRETAVFPVAGMKTVQHHGAVEIMRGCPNGCRFCHAGYWYRPMRQKSSRRVLEEAAAFVNRGGYREISLSSLSSGDYAGIENLVDALNDRFGGRHISFQLPSLKVSSFNLSLLEKISETRRSGLTFAVETPADIWQMSINKEASRDSAVEIIREAKKRGWRGAKFYFMIGLPAGTRTPDPSRPGTAISEEDEIVNFITGVGRGTGMRFNINVGIFVPKPHTPFQWAAQIDSGGAEAKLAYIRAKLKPLGHKVSVSDSLVSRIEGVLSRGDERAGDLVEEAWRRGSRLDAWQEYIDKAVWRDILEENRELVDELTGTKDPALPLPWRAVNPLVSPATLLREKQKSETPELTAPCSVECAAPCGACGTHSSGIVVNRIENAVNNNADASNLAVNRENRPVTDRAPGREKSDPAIWRLLFSFSKTGGAAFHGHLSLVEIFSMAFTRAGLPVMYTQGFNPLAKIEITAPLSTGVSADAEIAAADFLDYVAVEDFVEKLNRSLPEGFHVGRAERYFIPRGWKKHSLSSLLWGFGYRNAEGGIETIKAAEEKQFRQKMAGEGFSLFQLRRTEVLAKDLIDKNPETGISFFNAYGFVYPDRKC